MLQCSCFNNKRDSCIYISSSMSISREYDWKQHILHFNTSLHHFLFPARFRTLSFQDELHTHPANSPKHPGLHHNHLFKILPLYLYSTGTITVILPWNPCPCGVLRVHPIISYQSRFWIPIFNACLSTALSAAILRLGKSSHLEV